MYFDLGTEFVYFNNLLYLWKLDFTHTHTHTHTQCGKSHFEIFGVGNA